MVILDNAKDRNYKFKSSYTKAKVENIVASVADTWRTDIQKPSVVLVSPGENTANVSLLKNFAEWIDMH